MLVMGSMVQKNYCCACYNDSNHNPRSNNINNIWSTDEYDDTNKAQYNNIISLFSKHYNNIDFYSDDNNLEYYNKYNNWTSYNNQISYNDFQSDNNNNNYQTTTRSCSSPNRWIFGTGGSDFDFYLHPLWNHQKSKQLSAVTGWNSIIVKMVRSLVFFLNLLVRSHYVWIFNTSSKKFINFLLIASFCSCMLQLLSHILSYDS